MLSVQKYKELKVKLYDTLTDKKGAEGTSDEQLKKLISAEISNKSECKLLCACIDVKIHNWILNGVMRYDMYEELIEKVAKKAGTLKLFAKKGIEWWIDTLEEDVPSKPSKKKNKPLRGKVAQLQGDVARPITERDKPVIDEPEMGKMLASNEFEMGEPPEMPDKPPVFTDIPQVMGSMPRVDFDAKSQENNGFSMPINLSAQPVEPEQPAQPLMGDVAKFDDPFVQNSTESAESLDGNDATPFKPVENPAPAKPLTGAVAPVKPRSDGKQICDELRVLRKKVADENGIPYETEPCTYDGPCAGTCPKCDEEAAYIEKALSEKENKKD